VNHIWVCKCGHDTVLGPFAHKMGECFQCPGCKDVYAKISKPTGSHAWVLVADSDVKFHGLLDEPEDD
jgi:hypothetical protein